MAQTRTQSQGLLSRSQEHRASSGESLPGWATALDSEPLSRRSCSECYPCMRQETQEHRASSHESLPLHWSCYRGADAVNAPPVCGRRRALTLRRMGIHCRRLRCSSAAPVGMQRP